MFLVRLQESLRLRALPSAAKAEFVARCDVRAEARTYHSAAGLEALTEMDLKRR
jgi:hypothetical protein